MTHLQMFYIKTKGDWSICSEDKDFCIVLPHMTLTTFWSCDLDNIITLRLSHPTNAISIGPLISEKHVFAIQCELPWLKG